MANWYLGTVGFSYKDWDGVFYPAGTQPRSYLAHYSKVFNAVEVDSTFYGTPPKDRVQRWAATVPPDFKFCVKTPRQITHDLGLMTSAIDAMADFLETISLFGDKLGAVLIQLPPNFTLAQADTVDTFLAKLPKDYQYAIEFRHESWYTDDVVRLLENYGVCWVSIDYLDLPKRVTPTTNFLYMRWLGWHGQFTEKDREQLDVTPQLHWWQKHLKSQLDQTQAIYGFFNNDYSGHSPATCNRFKTMVGLQAITPQLPKQGRLF